MTRAHTSQPIISLTIDDDVTNGVNPTTDGRHSSLTAHDEVTRLTVVSPCPAGLAQPGLTAMTLPTDSLTSPDEVIGRHIPNFIQQLTSER